jgi:hypothetical protein
MGSTFAPCTDLKIAKELEAEDLEKQSPTGKYSPADKLPFALHTI